MKVASKTCTNCNLTKPFGEFSKWSSNKLGFKSECKSCSSARWKRYYKENRESLLGRNEQYDKQYYVNNRESIKARTSEYYYNNKERIVEQRKIYYANNKERIAERGKDRYANNKLEIIARNGEYARNKRATDPTFRAHLNYRNLSKRYWTSDSRNVADHRLVSKETYSLWINYQQQLNDASYNYHLDERWPQSKFDLDNPYHRLIATNVVNYCPMDPIENMKKSNKIIPKILLDQIEIAKRFLLEVELSPDERLKFKFLTMMYSNFVKYQLVIVLKGSNIAI